MRLKWSVARPTPGRLLPALRLPPLFEQQIPFMARAMYRDSALRTASSPPRGGCRPFGRPLCRPNSCLDPPTRRTLSPPANGSQQSPFSNHPRPARPAAPFGSVFPSNAAAVGTSRSIDVPVSRQSKGSRKPTYSLLASVFRKGRSRSRGKALMVGKHGPTRERATRSERPGGLALLPPLLRSSASSKGRHNG